MEFTEDVSKPIHHKREHHHLHEHDSHLQNHQKDQETHQSHSSKKRQASKKKKRHHKHMGGLSNVPFESVIRYFDHLHHTRRNMLSEHLEWKQSIHNFKKIINSDPVLRMNWEYGIYQCSKTLPEKSGEDVLNMIDTAVKTPPTFSHSDLVGFPINSIFLEFMQNENGRNFFSNQRINHALKVILADYNQMLHSQTSLYYMNEDSPNGWLCPEAWDKIDYTIYDCDTKKPHYGFKCWNQWFLRQFKAGLRPLGAGSPGNAVEHNIIINSCESTPLVYPKQPSFNVKLVDKFWLKDDLYSLVDMFGAERYNKHQLATHFEGGTVYQAFLSALFYHRWHAPISGVIQDIYGIDGTYFLDQSQFIPYDEGSPNNSQSFLAAVAARKVFIIKADNHKIGKIAIIFIGMAEVSSCVQTVKIGDRVKKGDQIGHFAYGGSSHVIIFEKNLKLKFNDSLYEPEQKEKELTAVKQNLHSYLALVCDENEA